MHHKKTTKVDHTLIGKSVWYKDRIWKVISAHCVKEQMDTPWLTLKRDAFIEAVVKASEVIVVLN